MNEKKLNAPISAFKIPKNGLIYTTSIVERCKRLIRAQVWAGLAPSTLDAWFANFINDEERYFAACLLDALIYRSELQMIALLKQVLDRELPACLAKMNPHSELVQGLRQYLRAPPPDLSRPLVLVPVIRLDDPPTKSGPMIARLLKRHLNVDEKHILWPWQIGKSLKEHQTSHVVFIDDFLGTGTQFKTFASEFKLEEIMASQSCIYTPLAAHRVGIQKLSSLYPTLKIQPVEQLTAAHDLFSTASPQFNDGVNSSQSAKQFYRSILRRAGYRNKGNREGFGGLGLVYAFQHGTPNNSLPILWWGMHEKWQPLFKR